MKVRTRFAPSPTGFLHIGGLRTAAYAYALAKHNAGDFILRIEDTDKKRFVEGSTEKIQEILKIFGMSWDEYYVQSERLDLYKKAAEKLLSENRAFYCQCPPKPKDQIYDKPNPRDPCRDKKFTSGAIKLRVPDNEKISFTDFVFQKEITWDTNTIPDTVLLKSDGFPTYHLAVVVDDVDMKISHVLRGYDWMPSTPIHLLIYKYLGLPLPEIGHLTDIQDPAGGKLSKRKGNVSCEEFLALGYLPEALLNFVILLGWAPKDNRELFTLPEFVANFDPKGFQKANPIFNTVKLDWFNQQYIRKLPDQELIQKIKKFSDKNPEKVLPLVKDRLVTLKDFDELTDYFWKRPTKVTTDLTEHARQILEKKWDGKVLEEEARKYCSEKNIKVGDYFMALRLAITGKKATPPLWDVMAILGKEETLARLNA